MIVTIMDNRDYIRVLLYSYFTTTTREPGLGLGPTKTRSRGFYGLLACPGNS